MQKTVAEVRSRPASTSPSKSSPHPPSSYNRTYSSSSILNNNNNSNNNNSHNSSFYSNDNDTIPYPPPSAHEPPSLPPHSGTSTPQPLTKAQLQQLHQQHHQRARSPSKTSSLLDQQLERMQARSTDSK